MAVQVFNAFRRGRAYIVANQYDLRDEEAKKIQELSKLIAQKAVYLNGICQKLQMEIQLMHSMLYQKDMVL